MWDGRAVESSSGRGSTFGGTSSLSSSMVVSSSSPRLSSSEAPTCSMLDRRRHSELGTTSNEEMLVPPVHDDQSTAGAVTWQLLSVTLRRVPTVGFGIAVSGGRDNPHFTSGDPSVVVSDVVPSGPAWGLVQVNDRILSANGVSLENAEYAAAVKIMRESQQLNMIVKRRAPIPLIEFEQRTLKFTLSKSRKKEDFGIVLGCKYYIKEITNRKLAEKDPGLREGDTVLRINGQSVDGVTIEEATKWLLKSREKLSLVVQRDVRRGSSRWPSQTTVYERLGSLSATPRHSPSPMLSAHQPLAQRSSNDYVNNTAHSTRWPQADQQPVDYGEYCRRNGSISSSQGQAENNVRVVSFRKVGGSLGVRVIGGNRVGIFVSAVQEDSPAAKHSIRPGERILAVNDKSMVGVTREEAVRHLLSLSDDVVIKVEYAHTEFEQIRNGQLGDDFYVRTHFANQKVTNQLELTFHNGDIFHVTDTLFGGTVGLWQATRVYSAAESADGALREPNKGVIPNAETAQVLMKAARAADTGTLGRSTFFRRKLKERRTKSLTKNAIDDVAFSEASGDVPLPAYERVVLTHPPFQRPVVLYGPLADVARQMLLANFALRFASARDQSIVRLSSIDAVIAADKHCVLDVSPGSVERLHLAQYAPIVILIDVESRARIRELRAKAGAPSISSRKLIEQMHKIKKHYSHLLTATLDATKEDGWFEALRQLIAHLQDRRVWMPEFRLSSNPSDVILLPMQSFQNQSDSDVDSLKGDYSTSDYATKVHLQGDNDPTTLRSVYEPLGSDYGGQHVPRALHVARSQPPSGFLSGASCSSSSYYQNVQDQMPRSEPVVGTFGVPLGNANPKQSVHSPARRYMLEASCDVVPWATLPRRHNFHHQVTTNQPQLQMLQLTTSPFATTAVAQHSPAFARRSQQHRASPALISSPSTQMRPLAGSSVSPVRSPYPPPHASPMPSRPHSSPAPLTPPLIHTHLADLATPQPISNWHGYYDVKQILAEQSSDYYGRRGSAEMPSGQHYQNAQRLPYVQQLQSFAAEGAQQAQAGVRCGLFYDHLTRGRWAAGSYNERRLGSTPVQGQPAHSILRSSPATSSPLHTESIVNDSPVRYADESPKSEPDHDEVNNGNANDARLRPKDDIPNDSAESQTNATDSNNTAENKEEREATVIEHVSQVVDSNGCTLSCPESGVMLIIPKGAIDEGVQQEIYVKVCRANCDESRPPLDESRGESLMSPLVMCGPQDLHFNVPVELRLPHSASNNGENWSFALKSGTGEQWNQIALDGNNSSLVTDKFASVKICHF